MQRPEMDAAAPGRQPGSSGKDSLTPLFYREPADIATDLAVAVFAMRHRLPITIARVYCELNGIGGRHE